MGIENSVNLIGHLDKDPERASTQNGTLVATFNMATNSHFKNKTSGEKETATEWHRVVFFDKRAENILDLLKKGSHVTIAGRLRTRKWTDSKGVDRWTTEVIGEEFLLLDKKESGTSADDLAQGTPHAEPSVPFDDDIPL